VVLRGRVARRSCASDKATSRWPARTAASGRVQSTTSRCVWLAVDLPQIETNRQQQLGRLNVGAAVERREVPAPRGGGAFNKIWYRNRMPASPAADPILKRFRAALDTLYGDRIERVVLFGSRARGDAREDSDYDVAVFLKSLADRWQEVDRIVPLVTDILYEDGAFIHAMPHRAGSYEDRTSLMREIRREGVDL
jgi:predicted nucleotidyltransferase